jgi:hypothetical protein
LSGGLFLLAYRRLQRVIGSKPHEVMFVFTRSAMITEHTHAVSQDYFAQAPASRTHCPQKLKQLHVQLPNRLPLANSC